MDDIGDVIVTLVIAGVSFFLGLVIGAGAIQEALHEEAIEHGYAEFVIVDQATGKTEFRWIESDAKEAD